MLFENNRIKKVKFDSKRFEEISGVRGYRCDLIIMRKARIFRLCSTILCRCAYECVCVCATGCIFVCLCGQILEIPMCPYYECPERTGLPDMVVTHVKIVSINI